MTFTPVVRSLGLVALTLVACRLVLAAPEKRAEEPAAAEEPSAEEKENPRRQGQWIRIPLPIDNSVVLRVKQSMERTLGATAGERPVFVLEFVASDGAGGAGQGTQFEDAHKLARFLTSDEVNGAGTVAFVPRALKGHAVLVAMACEKIIMSPSATLGDAGADEKVINNTMLAAYEEIARSRLTVPPEVALGLLDKSREVLKVKTEMAVRFAAPGQLPEITRGHRILAKETIKRPGKVWQFTGVEGRDWGIVKFLAEDNRDVIRQMQLSPGIEEGDPSAGGAWRPIRVELKGPIKANQIVAIQRRIQEELRTGVNFICLWIDSPGGSPLESKRLADFLAGLPREEVRTVAYVPSEARADAAMVAMACDQIVMHPRAVLGGPGQYQMKSSDEILRNQLALRDSLAPRKNRSWSLWAAMFNPHLDVYRCHRLGDVEYFGDEELLSRQPKPGEKGPPWEKGERVTAPGQVLSLSGDKAQEYGLATRVVENFTEFKHNYGLENDLTLVEPGWVDHVAQFLGRQEMVALLIFLGGLGIYIELHAPGLGVGAFIAVLAFALFFWSRFLEGTAGWLEVTLFVTGCICLLTEIFVLPGFVIFGSRRRDLDFDVGDAGQPDVLYSPERVPVRPLAEFTVRIGPGRRGSDWGCMDVEPLAASRPGVAARLSRAARGRRGRDYQSPRDAGRFGQPPRRGGRGDDSLVSRRQGPFRQPPGGRDIHGRVHFPR